MRYYAAFTNDVTNKAGICGIDQIMKSAGETRSHNCIFPEGLPKAIGYQEFCQPILLLIGQAWETTDGDAISRPGGFRWMYMYAAINSLSVVVKSCEN
jgi:hypothetical protein